MACCKNMDMMDLQDRLLQKPRDASSLREQRPLVHNLHRNIPLHTKKITELIPRQFRFGNSSTEITEYNSQNISVRWTQGFGNPQLTVITEMN